MLRFGGPAVLGRAPAQAFDQVLIEVADQELGLMSHDINDSIVAPHPGLPAVRRY